MIQFICVAQLGAIVLQGLIYSPSTSAFCFVLFFLNPASLNTFLEKNFATWKKRGFHNPSAPCQAQEAVRSVSSGSYWIVPCFELLFSCVSSQVICCCCKILWPQPLIQHRDQEVATVAWLIRTRREQYLTSNLPIPSVQTSPVPAGHTCSV